MLRLIGSCLFLVATLSRAQPNQVLGIELSTGKSAPLLRDLYTTHEILTTPDARSLAPNTLPDQLPELNVMEGTHFTISAPPDNSFDVSGFPASTTVQLVMYKNKKSVGQCSGTLVSRSLVLTSAHCLLNPESRVLECDEVIVVAAGKNQVDGGMLLTTAGYAYVLKNYATNISSEDIMLLSLLEPIGEHTGWMGVRYLDDSAFNDKSIFHKLSYPALAPGEDPRVTKGRRLHYNYGAMDVLSDNLLGIAAGEAIQTPGQSGSSLFIVEDGLPYVTGLAIYASRYQHQRITKSIINIFKPIIDRSIASANYAPFLLYPNPVTEHAVIKITHPLSRFTILVINSAGALVRTQSGNDSNTFIIERGTLPAGPYQFRIVDEKERIIRGSFWIE